MYPFILTKNLTYLEVVINSLDVPSNDSLRKKNHVFAFENYMRIVFSNFIIAPIEPVCIFTR